MPDETVNQVVLVLSQKAARTLQAALRSVDPWDEDSDEIINDILKEVHDQLPKKKAKAKLSSKKGRKR